MDEHMQNENDQVSIDDVNGTAVIELSGQFLGGDETDHLKQTLSDMADAGKTVVLDMHQVTFVNSSFLGSLLSAHTHADRRGADLVLAGIKDSIAHIISLTRMDKVLDIRSSREEALKSSNTNT